MMDVGRSLLQLSELSIRTVLEFKQGDDFQSLDVATNDLRALVL